MGFTATDTVLMILIRHLHEEGKMDALAFADLVTGCAAEFAEERPIRRQMEEFADALRLERPRPQLTAIEGGKVD